MNFNVDASLKNAVESFSWDVQETGNDLLIHVNDLSILVTEISQKIFTAAQLRPTLEPMAKKTLSLAEICYLIVQDQDRKLANPEILNLIQHAATNEKIILKHALKKLTEDFVNVTQPDLKVLTLLFGIKRIFQVASNTVFLFNSQAEEIHDLEITLNELVAKRRQFDIRLMPDLQKAYLQEIDRAIQQASARLETLKLSFLATKAA